MICLIALCDGTDQVRVRVVVFSTQDRLTRYLQAARDAQRVKALWMDGKGTEMTISQVVALMRKKQITLYMIDDGACYQCSVIDGIEVCWTEVL